MLARQEAKFNFKQEERGFRDEEYRYIVRQAGMCVTQLFASVHAVQCAMWIGCGV